MTESNPQRRRNAGHARVPDAVTPGALSRLSARQVDRKAWTAILTLALWTGLFAGVAVLSWHPLVVGVCMILIASRQHACFVLVHDAAHYRLLRDRRHNDLVGRLLGACIGIPMPAYRGVHRLHHRHLLDREDPDLPIYAAYPRGPGYLLKKLGRDLMGLTALRTYGYFFGLQTVDDATGRAQRGRRHGLARLRLLALGEHKWVIGIQLGAPVVALLSGFLLEYLLLWLLPMLTFLQVFLRFRSVLEHAAIGDVPSQLEKARSHVGNPLLIWLLFPYNVNFHAEHHLYPAVPFYHLKEVHMQLQRQGTDTGVDIRDTLSRVMAPGGQADAGRAQA